MRVALRIERLVLDGVELTQRERAALRPAIERALWQRFAGRAAPADGNALAGDRALAGDPGAAAPAGAPVERLGAQIADAVYGQVPRAGGRR